MSTIIPPPSRGLTLSTALAVTVVLAPYAHALLPVVSNCVVVPATATYTSSFSLAQADVFRTPFARRQSAPFPYASQRHSRTRLRFTSINTDEDIAEATQKIDQSNDPFVILGLGLPTTDQKVIKRAYKRRALKFHPDVVVTQDTTADEKKMASDRFAKINWAYQTLSGKRERGDATYGGAKAGSGTGSGTSTAGEGWSPPHRRSGAYSSSSSSSSSSTYGNENNPWDNISTDWRDYMPKTDDDEKYDAGGDSFEKIFSDLFATAATGAVGVAGTGANLFVDFIEFLEGNIDGYSGTGSSSPFSSSADDAELQVLLRTGSFDDVANEMDDTNLVVEQLQSKLTNLKDEILTVTAESKMTSRYMERIELEERLAELNARKDVVNGYLQKAQKRLLALQTRYKQLMTQGVNDPYAGGRSRGAKSGAGSTSYSSSSYTSSTSSSASTSRKTNDDIGTSKRSTTPPRDAEEAWMNEGFGSSSGRGSRGSGRRRSRQPSTSARGATSSSASDTSSPKTSYDSSSSRSSDVASFSWPSSTQTSSRSSTNRRESVRPPQSTSSRPLPSSVTQSEPFVPPHRRTASYASQQEEQKRRLQEIKVDEEFDRLKEELGL